VWSGKWIKLTEDKEAGKDVRLNLENARRTVSDLEGRLENRKKELQAMRHVISATPVALGGALVIPIGLLNKLRGDSPADANAALFASDPAARSRIEKLGMDAVRRAEEARGGLGDLARAMDRRVLPVVGSSWSRAVRTSRVSFNLKRNFGRASAPSCRDVIAS